MKNILLTAALCSAVFSLHAQKNKVTSTANYLRYEEYDNAKAAIDEASANPATADWWKTWYYKAQTYKAIALSKDPKVNGLDPNALIVSSEAYQKTLSYDDPKMDKNAIKREFASLNNSAFNKGLELYNANNYNEAIKYFQLSESINLALNNVDSALTYNIALTALNAENNEVALQYLDKCISNNFKGVLPYSEKANLLTKTDKIDDALVVLKEGRAKYPENTNLLTQELNIYLKTGRMEEALANLNVAVEKDPSNYLFYYARGTIHDNKGNLEAAVTDYKKSIELKPDFFDANYNLGAAYYNEGAKKMNEANDIPPSKVKEFEEAKSQAIEMLKLSLPFLDKADSINNKDEATLTSLKTVYTLIGDAPKALEYKTRLEGLK
jgi:tetratricopeptide (TPR) repeat protein